MSQNFEASIVYCCPCVLELVKFEISRRDVVTQVLQSDFIRARFNTSILIEFFPLMEGILITCTRHLADCFCFDWKWCNHYNGGTFFHFFLSSKFFVSVNAVRVINFL